MEYERTPESEQERFNQALADLIEVRDQKEIAYSTWQDLRAAEKTLEFALAETMRSKQAKKCFGEDGTQFTLNEEHKYKYNNDLLLTLQSEVPEHLWEGAYKGMEVVHKFHQPGLKQLLKLGGSIRNTIEAAMEIENTNYRISIKKAVA